VSVAKSRAVIVATILISLWTSLGWSQVLRVVGFNVESGGARPDVVDDLIEEAQGVDLWGFSEVHDDVWSTCLRKPPNTAKPQILDEFSARPAARIGS